MIRILVLLVPVLLLGQDIDLAKEYVKREYRIPMRDGVRLHTIVYTPKDTAKRWPIMLGRTPYTVAPYGDEYLKAGGNNHWMAQEGYIMVFQDVRGRFMSEGEYEDIRPYIPDKRSKKETDESSDAYDTIGWLLKNLRHHNGKAGMIGISYPGYYAAMGMIDAHPALKAVSPQAPIADWFLGDDFHHNGAVMLIDAFNFYRSFGKPRPALTTAWPPGFPSPSPDAYRFLLDAGPLASIKRRFYGDTAKFWNDVFAHPDYDEFWKARSLPQHMKNIRPAVLFVGGSFDAEDLPGPLKLYAAVERNDPKNRSALMVGPWFHGGWVRSDGSRLGDIAFGGVKSSERYDRVIRAFFAHHLKGAAAPEIPEVSYFETGANVWRSYDAWPPKDAVKKRMYLREGGSLSFDAPASGAGADEYVSDPMRPVPYTNHITDGRGREYMTEDQRFAWQRPDVLSYETPVLTEDLSVAGPANVELFFSSTQSDADVVVKVIDVYPDDAKDDTLNAKHIKMGGYQMLVRGEVMRLRYRNSFERPEPLTPGAVTPVRYALPDFHHTFRKGHRMMVQVQSSWFPLVDRNPQRFVNIYTAHDTDFVRAVHTVQRNRLHPSHVEFGVMEKK